MLSSLTTLLIVAFVCLFLGTMAGLLLGSLREEREEETPDAPESPPGGRQGRYVSVARLWREKSTETLVVEVDGKSYLAPTPLNAVQREALEKGAADLAAWLGVVVQSGPIPPVETVPAAAPAPVPAAPASAPSPAAQQSAPAVQSQPDSQPVRIAPPPVSTPPPAPVGIQPIGVLRALTNQPVTPVKEEPKSIVGQVNAILQTMLANTPLEDRGIALTEDPRKGVIVEIGLNRYEGIDSVPDAEIKALIRAAIAEWERRQEKPAR